MEGTQELNELPGKGLSAEFRRFWLAAAVFNLGDGIRLAALPLLALGLTDDARLISGVRAASFVPWIVIGPLAGALLDRQNRRTLMLLGQAGRGLAVLLLAASVSGGWANIAMLYLAALVVSTGETIVDSASQAAIPQLVDGSRLERANGQLNVAQNLFNGVVGVAVGAFLFSRASSLPFYVDALTFALGALLLATIRRPLQGARAASKTLRAEIVEGLRFLLRHRFLRSLALSVAATNLALNMGFGVLVVLVVHEIHATEAAYGTILAVGAVGGVIGSVVAGRLTELLTPRRVLMVTRVPFILAATLTAAATKAWMMSAAFGMSSFALVLFQIPSRALRQRVTPDRLQGRVVAAFRLFGLGGPVVGAPIGGVIAEALGVRWACAASAAIMVIAWLLMLGALEHLGESGGLTDTPDAAQGQRGARQPVVGPHEPREAL